MPTATLTVWSEEECRRLHEATLAVLSDIGVEILGHGPSLDAFRELGADVDGDRVRLHPSLVTAALEVPHDRLAAEAARRRYADP